MSAKTLSALLQSATIDDHEEVLQACNTSLKQSKKDPGVQHVKVVALLKLDRYDELKNKAGVERAYALYKIGKLVEAKEIVTGIVNDRGARHVEAQAVRIPSISKGHLGASS